MSTGIGSIFGGRARFGGCERFGGGETSDVCVRLGCGEGFGGCERFGTWRSSDILSLLLPIIRKDVLFICRRERREKQ